MGIKTLWKIWIVLHMTAKFGAKVVGQAFEDGPGKELRSGVPVTSIARKQSSTAYWTMIMPIDASSVTCSISGGTGDADLYTNWDAPLDLDIFFNNTVSRQTSRPIKQSTLRSFFN